MQNSFFLPVSVGRVGRALFSSVSRPTIKQKTEVDLKIGGFDTPLASAHGYSTTNLELAQ
jgi:hypothetical protein